MHYSKFLSYTPFCEPIESLSKLYLRVLFFNLNNIFLQKRLISGQNGVRAIPIHACNDERENASMSHCALNWLKLELIPLMQIILEQVGRNSSENAEKMPIVSPTLLLSQLVPILWLVS